MFTFQPKKLIEKRKLHPLQCFGINPMMVGKGHRVFNVGGCRRNCNAVKVLLPTNSLDFNLEKFMDNLYRMHGLR
jgi:hypothetical protein